MTKIKCAAVIHCGRIFLGRRHGDAIKIAVEQTGIKPVQVDSQGFITEEGKFVDRQEAARIAFEAGQISQPKEELYSEDLY